MNREKDHLLWLFARKATTTKKKKKKKLSHVGLHADLVKRFLPFCDRKVSGLYECGWAVKGVRRQKTEKQADHHIVKV